MNKLIIALTLLVAGCSGCSNSKNESPKVNLNNPNSIVNNWVYIYESCDGSLKPSMYDLKLDIKSDSIFQLEIKQQQGCQVSYNGTYELNGSHIKLITNLNSVVQSPECTGSQTPSEVVNSNYSFQYGNLYLEYSKYGCNEAAMVFKKRL